MASTHKKVIVRKMGRDSVQGYVAAGEFLVGSKVEVLNTAGNVVLIDLAEIKGVYFVQRLCGFQFSAAKDIYNPAAGRRPMGPAALPRRRDAGRIDAE